MRKFAPTKAPQSCCLSCRSVVHDDVVIGTLLMRFQVKLREDEFDPVTRSRGVEPGAVFAGGIRVGPVRTLNLPGRRRDVVRAAALFAVVLVVVQDEAVVAGAREGADRVFADVLAAAVVDRALVFVCRKSVGQSEKAERKKQDVVTGEEQGSKAALLHGGVGAELDAEAVADGSHHRRDLRSTEHAVLLVLAFRCFAANFYAIILAVLLLITMKKAKIKCQAWGAGIEQRLTLFPSRSK